MATGVDDSIKLVEGKIRRFAKEYIASREDLYNIKKFPSDIWLKMGSKKLLGFGVSNEFGGLEGDYLTISVAGRAFVKNGHNIGITLSWMIHQLIARFFISQFGTKEQHYKYLNDMATGRITMSIAVSEAEKGAHPKHLRTFAENRDQHFIINGGKAYITNGPIADYFIVVAVTKTEGGKNYFTAFIVPRQTKGLTLTAPMSLPFFKASPHGGIKLEDCLVPEENILGKQNVAYQSMVIPFREIEGALMMGPVIGGMERQLELLTSYIRESEIAITDKLRSDIGKLRSIVDTGRVISYEAAKMLDSNINHNEFMSLILYFRNLSRDYQTFLSEVVSGSSIEVTEEFEFITNDLVNSGGIARNIAYIKQLKIGASLIESKSK